MTEMFQFLSDYTIRNVLMGACLLGISSGILGSFAVLRQQSLLGDTLSHAALPGICLGFLIAGSRQLLPILLGALLSGLMAALLVLLLSRRSRLKTDASLGISLSVFFAIGTVLLTYIQQRHGASQAGLDAFLFGQAAAILPADLWIIGTVSVVALLLVGALWKEFKLVTFDPAFATSLGLPVLVIELVLTTLIAMTVVIGLQLVGVILMTAMLIAPAAAARQWSNSLATMVSVAAGFAVLSGVTGALISASTRGLATGPVIVLSASVIFIVSLMLAPGRGLLWELGRSYRYRKSLASQRILRNLYQLSQSHQNPSYASEQGMLDSLHGVSTQRQLQALQKEGLIEAVQQAQKSVRWRLTAKGYQEAQALQAPQD